MSAQLKARGYHVGRRKTRRYMNEMDIYPIYPNRIDSSFNLINLSRQDFDEVDRVLQFQRFGW